MRAVILALLVAGCGWECPEVHPKLERVWLDMAPGFGGCPCLIWADPLKLDCVATGPGEHDFREVPPGQGFGWIAHDTMAGTVCVTGLSEYDPDVIRAKTVFDVAHEMGHQMLTRAYGDGDQGHTFTQVWGPGGTVDRAFRRLNAPP